MEIKKFEAYNNIEVSKSGGLQCDSKDDEKGIFEFK